MEKKSRAESKRCLGRFKWRKRVLLLRSGILSASVTQPSKKKIRVLPSGVEPMAVWSLVEKEKAFLGNFLVQKAWSSSAPVNWEHKLIEYDHLWSVVLNRTVAYRDRHFDDLFGSIVIIFKVVVYRQLIVFYSTGLLIWMLNGQRTVQNSLWFSVTRTIIFYLLRHDCWVQIIFFGNEGIKRRHTDLSESEDRTRRVAILRWLVCNGVDLFHLLGSEWLSAKMLYFTTVKPRTLPTDFERKAFILR